MKKILVLLLVLGGVFLFLLPASAATAEPSAIALHTFSGKTMGGVAVGLHLIPESATNPTQDWCAKHITLDVLAAGTALDAMNATLGASVNLLAPEAGLKLGVTYLWQEKEPAAYLGFSFGL